jgi:outer membrane biosynthesis protein TonB
LPSEAPSAGELVTADELDLAEDAELGEAERALLRWALRQRERAPGEPLLPTRNEPLPPAETPTPAPPPRPTPAPAARAVPIPVPEPRPAAAPVAAPKPKPMRLWPEPAPEAAPARTPPSRPEAAPPPTEDRQPSPWERLHSSAEEAISALVAAGGPDPRDYASPRLDRRAKMVIALALVVLFVVSVLGGFVGYRVTHRAAGGGSQSVARPAGIHAGPAAPADTGV